MPNYITSSSAATRKLGAACARQILKTRPGHHAAVIALSGNLGSGKTTFTQGFFRGLGLRARPTSPTFVIMKRYQLSVKSYKFVHHVDAYRIHTVKALEHLGFKKILADPSNIVIIEWADRIRRLLPRRTTWVHFRHGAKENERAITAQSAKIKV